jgi:predicted nucleotidyltransferase
MDISRPFASVSPGVESDVLVALARAKVPRTGRELARRSGRSPTGVQHALDRLVDEGLVHQTEAGRAFLYSFNRDHLLAPAVKVMAEARGELINRLRDLIGAWKVPTFHASLFGSFARGEGNAASDIDLLVVRPKDIDLEDERWRAQIDELVGSVSDWTGNHAGISEVSEADLPRLRKERPPVVEAVTAQAIDLAGTPVRKMLRASR